MDGSDLLSESDRELIRAIAKRIKVENAREAARIVSDIDLAVDVVDLLALPGLLRTKIESEGELLYEKRE